MVGIYDADGSVLGELTYWVGARLGRRHCSLCDITHGLFSEKASWKECRADLGAPIALLHRDEISPEMRSVSDGNLPCVLVRGPDGSLEMGLGPDDLNACEGSPLALAARLDHLLDSRG